MPHSGGGCAAAGAGAPQHGLHPRHQLARAEWLGQIVVRAQFQPAYDVILLAAHGQQDNRRVGQPADTAADRKTIQPRHVDVQHDQVGRFLDEALHRGLAIVGHDDLEALPAQRKGQHIGQHAVVVYDQCFHDFISTLA